MKKAYICPHCKAVLNPNVKIIFVVDDGKHRGLILLSARPGDYRLIVDPNFPLVKGEKATFHCPVCDASLTSRVNENFVEIQLDHGGIEPSTVEFSRVFGEQATFILDGTEMTAFGEDADDFGDVNFFGSL
ncbi:hypothetical protein KKG45_10590 [bacterium]|nr:hypothetical protein [bacterium]MBU1073684.1 hypothetical protein [bacterium]